MIAASPAGFSFSRAVTDPRTDDTLLSRFISEHDSEAFAELVRRHGPMVMAVGRRVTGHRQDAEDAFQAVFLVLARKAGSVRPESAVGPWLYGVAVRTAMKARTRTLRRREVEADYAGKFGDSRAQDAPSELASVLDEQIAALPEKYRLPLLLCGVQGMDKATAAQQLGWAEGTVSSRLARARELLRTRLTRRGVIVPLVGLSSLFTGESVRAEDAVRLADAVSASLAGTPGALSPAVLTLSQEVLGTMSILNWKLILSAAVAVGLAGGGIGLVSLNAQDKPKPKPTAPADKTEKPKPANPGEKSPKTTPDKTPADKPAGTRVSGKIGAVDASKNSLTFSRGDSNKNETEHSVAKDVKVRIDGKPGDVASIPVGAYAEAFINEDTKQIIAISLSGPRENGILKAANATQISVTTADNEKPRDFKLSPEAKIMVDGKANGTAADLKPGMRVGLQLSTDGVTVVLMKAGSADRQPEKKPGQKPDAEPSKKPVKKPADNDK